MPIVVREEGSVPIPEDLAQEFGIHRGVPVEWERTPDGRLALRPAMTRADIARSLLGAGRKDLKPGESGVENFLRGRQEERELDDPDRRTG